MKEFLKQESGINLLALMLSIVIIIILAAVSMYYGQEGVSQATKMEILAEMRNVKEAILRREAYIKAGQIVPNEAYLLTGEEKENWKAKLDAGYQMKDSVKYYKMTPEQFKAEFADDVSVPDIERTYIVSYEDREVILIEGISIDGIRYYALSDLIDAGN